MHTKRAAGEPGPTTYDLYLESGPRRRKTMVYVPQLLGCVAVGLTNDEDFRPVPNGTQRF
jgi:hypothetical protein